MGGPHLFLCPEHMFKVGKKGYYQETVRKYNGERLYVSWYV